MKYSFKLARFPLLILLAAACAKNSAQNSDTSSAQTPQAPAIPAVPRENPPVPHDSMKEQLAPYANDFGEAEVDERRVPDSVKKGYQLLKSRCAQCHTPARPLNAQYIEVDAAFRDQLLHKHPELFTDPNLLWPDVDLWRRLVKRMAAKPGSNIASDDAKEIYTFLVWLYKDRIGPQGEHAEAWRDHRRKLLEDFKKKYPERYKELYENK